MYMGTLTEVPLIHLQDLIFFFFYPFIILILPPKVLLSAWFKQENDRE